jgi:hypothetical protein
MPVSTLYTVLILLVLLVRNFSLQLYVPTRPSRFLLLTSSSFAIIEHHLSHFFVSLDSNGALSYAGYPQELIVIHEQQFHGGDLLLLRGLFYRHWVMDDRCWSRRGRRYEIGHSYYGWAKRTYAGEE